jgi:hypothetical protein
MGLKSRVFLTAGQLKRFLLNSTRNQKLTGQLSSEQTPESASWESHRLALLIYLQKLRFEWLNAPNPSGKPNSDVLKTGGFTLKAGRQCGRPFLQHSRFLATCMVAKHRMFVWLDTISLPANVVIVFGRSDDYFLGVLQCNFHQIWSLKQGTQLETRPRYTPTTCFETFPFPFVNDLRSRKPPSPPEPESGSGWETVMESRFYTIREEPPPYGGGGPRKPGPGALRAAIAAAAKELNQFRENWLNPPEWTEERILEFPGSIAGPWAHYVIKPDRNGIGTVRYPRLKPRDADCAAKLKERTLTKLYNKRPDWLDFATRNLTLPLPPPTAGRPV